ncbi:hypothetical protein JCM19039_843 [Geomicrobium sp. JCM 19039]|nr:hypothetical protein JCM19039_843 [Geomicrobium sp. JCM 19039]
MLPPGYGVWKEVQMPHIFINVTIEKENHDLKRECAHKRCQLSQIVRFVTVACRKCPV